MNINKKYKLFRTIITDELRRSIPPIKERETHLVSIEMTINNDVWSSCPVAMQPFELKDKIISMKRIIIFNAKDHY